MAAKALSHQMSRVVRIKRTDLLKILQDNHANHLKVYAEAMAGYKELALQKIEEAFAGLADRLAARRAEVTRRVEAFSPETADEFASRFVILESVTLALAPPVSYAEAYEAAIDMARLDTREELDLSGAEFQCFCRDVWDWSHEFTAVNTPYLAFRK